MTRRVVVTGLGAVTPVGNDCHATWDNLVAGHSGVGPITRFDPAPFKTKIQAEVKDFDPKPLIPPKPLKHMDRNVQFGVAAAAEAMRDAGLVIDDANRDRVGVIVASGGGGVETLLHWEAVFRERGPRRISPFFMSNFIADAASGHIAIHTGATGPNFSPTSACAGGVNAVGDGFSQIRLGRADAMIVGGCEAVLMPVFHASFEAMGVLAPTTDPPAAACRPFDRDRNGFVPGEGGAILILEALDHARARGAEIYGEVVGSGSGNDATGMVASDPGGRGLVAALSQATREACIPLTDVGYVNTHGTGTQLNDRIETIVIKRRFGEHAYRLLVSSIKPATGHMMSASGALECLVCVLALQRGVIPPTLNYRTPDPECDLDCVPNEARAVHLRAALCTAVGLGGHNAAVLFRRWDG